MKRHQLLFLAAISWPASYTYYQLPAWCDFPYFITLALFAIMYFMPPEKEEQTEDDFIQLMREYAITEIKTTGFVTTDDLREWAKHLGLSAQSPQVWSKILTKPMFVKTGEKKSIIPSNDGRKIGVYRLEGEV